MLFERDIFQILKDIKDNYDSIYQISDDALFEIIENTLQNLYILTEKHNEFIKKIIKREKYGITRNEIEKLQKRVKYLKNVPQPEQRTPEWFEFRKDRLTASTISNIVGVGHFGNIKDIIKDKCGCSKVYRSGVATEHGVKYEDVACSIYATKTNSVVKEYGCIPHDTHTFLGASPDGITEEGRALEIKCPYSRKITGIPPDYYWCQMQLQLEVCDLDECDFLEMSIKEYSNRDEFIEDSNDNDTRMRKDGNYKGCLIECRRENTTSWDYHYIDYKKSLEDQLIEIEDIADMLMDKYDDILVLKKTYWKVEKYSCVRVYRDKIWFSEALEKMKQCWDKVLFFRKYGIEKIIKLKMPNNFLEMTEKELIEYIEKDRLEKLNKQNNKINKKSIIRKRTSFNQKCLIEDSDDESEITNNNKKQENKKKTIIKDKTIYLLDTESSDEHINVINLSKRSKKTKKIKKPKKNKKPKKQCLIMDTDSD